MAAHNIGNLTQVFGSKGTITLDNGDEKLWFAKAGQGFEEITEDDPNAAPAGPQQGHLERLGRGADARSSPPPSPRGARPRKGATFRDGLANQRVLDAVRIVGHGRPRVRPEDAHA